MSNLLPTRIVNFLEYGWKFTKEDIENATSDKLNDASWEDVRVPHDWAIDGPFSPENDKQIREVIADGILAPIIHTGRTGGLPVFGVGWYRKWIHIPAEYEGKRIYIEFDGIMSNSSIYINGIQAGGWPCGYTSFSIDLTDHITFGDKNLLAVRVEPKPGASRWYTGAGIYRNARLLVKSNINVKYCGTYITTTDISQKCATVNIRTELLNQSNANGHVTLATCIYDPLEQLVAEEKINLTIENEETAVQQLQIKEPQFWDIKSPFLYKAVSSIFIDGELVDSYESTFGIREITFDAKKGFFLNGSYLKLNGVCMHHDLGALGAAINVRAMERQLEVLKEFGCNSIRTSHNPPAPELLFLCDRMGFLVIDEAFDEWRVAKVKNGYSQLFDEWAEKDLTAFIKRDRNHPCVIMWSIGNEILDQNTPEGAKTAAWLTGICHALDATRPVTAGFNTPDNAIKNGLAEAVDIPGWNYKPHLYKQYHLEHPSWVMYGSETSSCVSSRGEYYLPAVEEKPPVMRDNLHVTSYDLAGPRWAYPPEYEFMAQDECPFILGEYVWTGFDYLGEPTPYNTEWPSRSSYFGIVDLCGIPKDRYYSYQSQWTDKEVLHIFPHWNWEGMEGEFVPVHCYTSFEEAELFLNGRSMGKRKKDPSNTFTRYRLIWEEVPYEPGILEVVAYNPDGTAAKTAKRQTAGKPYKVVLIPDRQEIKADGDDLCYITVRIEDENGILCPKANNEISFDVSGAGEFLAADNGDQTSLVLFQSPARPAFNGMCMLTVRSLKDAQGEISIKASGAGLIEAGIKVKSL